MATGHDITTKTGLARYPKSQDIFCLFFLLMVGALIGAAAASK
jgi:hypothetical protein